MLIQDLSPATHRYPTTEHTLRPGYGGDGYAYLTCASDDEALAEARREMPETTPERLERRAGDGWEVCDEAARAAMRGP